MLGLAPLPREPAVVRNDVQKKTSGVFLRKS